MSKLTCLVCLQKFPHLPDDNLTSSYQPRLLSSPPTCSEKNLYTRFLHFCTRHLKLTHLPLINGRKDNEVFCPECKCLVSCLCDLWHEMEVVKLHLVWKLTELGETFKVLGKNSKAEKDLIKQLELDSIRVRRFRTEVKQSCKQRRESNPKVVVSNRILPELWKFSFSETKSTLARLIFIFALAFDKVASKGRNCSQASNLKTEANDLSDAGNDSGGEDFNEFANDKDSDWSNPASPPGHDSDAEFIPANKRKRRSTRKRKIKMVRSYPKNRKRSKRGPYRKLPEPTCMICGEDLNTLSDLETHLISTHETDEKPHYCWFCAERFSLKETRLVHRWNDLEHNPKLFKCDYANCQKSFYCPDKHELHLRSHLESTPDGSQAINHCPKCNLGFFNLDHLEFHELNHLGVGDTFNCPKCTDSFPEKELLLIHYTSHLPVPALEDDLAEADDCEGGEDLKGSDWSNGGSPSGHDSDAEFNPAKPKRRRIARESKIKMEQSQPKKWKKKVELTKCPMCPQRFRKHVGFVEHLKLAHNIEKPSFKCDVCAKLFSTIYVLRKHIRKHHGQVQLDKLQIENSSKPRKKNPIPPPTCKICGEDLRTLSDLETHMISTHETDEKLHSCWFCPERFSLKETRLVHRWNGLKQKLHHHQKMFPCDHADCEQIFQCADKHEEHIHSHLGSTSDGNLEPDAIHHCSKCNLGFFHPDLLLFHELNHLERVDNTFTCPKCALPFTEKRLLILHYRAGHLKSFNRMDPSLESRKYKCDKCSYSTFDKWSLEKHSLRVHIDKERLECDQCGVICHGRRAKQIHLREEHHQTFEEYPCPVCGKSFVMKRQVTQHIRLVHREKRYFCDCGVGFNSNYDCEKHKRLYHDPNRIAENICSTCGKAYMTKEGLRLHINSIHVAEEEKGFGCPYCKKRFHREDLAKNHVKTCMKQKGLEVPDDNEIEVEWSAAAVEEKVMKGQGKRGKLISGRILKEGGEKGSGSFEKFLY